MTDSALTLKVLVEMREELRALAEVRDEVRALRDVREGLGEVRDELRAFRHDTNQRLEVIEHTMVDFGTQVVLLGRYMKNSVTRHDGDVERHEERSRTSARASRSSKTKS